MSGFDWLVQQQASLCVARVGTKVSMLELTYQHLKNLFFPPVTLFMLLLYDANLLFFAKDAKLRT